VTSRGPLLLPAALSAAVGAAAGLLMLERSWGAAGGAAIGLLVAAAVWLTGIRWIVAGPVVLGGAAGGFLGAGIVHTLCRPDGCGGLEAVAATLTGVGAMVGIGLVMALALRSFEEYRRAIEEERPPPTVGCETGEDS
jgi:hypothetical protein